MEMRLDVAIQNRHSRSVFPPKLHPRNEVHAQFAKDVQSMIDQRDRKGLEGNKEFESLMLRSGR
jgi:hypothetical protein